MNPYIKEQLSRCKVAQIPDFDDSTTSIIIPKNGIKKKLVDYELGGQYQIHVDDSLIQPGNWYDTIHGNWNQGQGPLENILNVVVIQIMGKMIKVNSIDINNRTWVGWLPKGNIDKLKDF